MRKTIGIFLLMGGCATASSGEGATTPNSAAKVPKAEFRKLQANTAEQHEKIRELEGRLALMESENRLVRDAIKQASPLAQGQTVVISSDDAAESLQPYQEQDTSDWAQQEALPGPRPVLRLYGNSTEATPGFQTHNQATYFRPEPVAVAMYRRALRLLLARNYDAAFKALNEFIRKFGKHPYSANAMYWRAEALYARRQYPEALRAFQLVLKRYPQGHKGPDALLKIAYCHERMGHTQIAKQVFLKVQQRYPESLAARAASREGQS